MAKRRLLLSASVLALGLGLTPVMMGPANAQFVCGGSTNGGEPQNGDGATGSGSPENTACGPGANASGTGSSNIATGNGANASGGDSQNIATGTNANASGTGVGGFTANNIATGTDANASGFGTNVAIGENANASGGLPLSVKV